MTRVALALLCLFATACHPGPQASRRERPVRDAGRLLARAGQALSCDQFTIVRLDPRAVQVTGCGATAEYTGDQWDPMPSVSILGRAALQCRDVHVLEPATRIRAVVGCGRTLRYDLVCTDEGCSWEPTVYAGAWTVRGTTAAATVSAWSEGPDAPLTTPDPFGEVVTPTSGGEVELPPAPAAAAPTP